MASSIIGFVDASGLVHDLNSSIVSTVTQAAHGAQCLVTFSNGKSYVANAPKVEIDVAAADSTAGVVAHAIAADAQITALAGVSAAADAVPYFTAETTASVFTCTAAARTVLDDTTVGAMVTTLGAQPADAELTAIAGLTSAADKGIMFTGSGTAAVYDLTAAGLALLDDASASAQRTTLGLAIGTDVQAYDLAHARVNATVPGAYPYTVLTTDRVVLVNTSEARSVQLPDPATFKGVVTIVDTLDASTFNITILRAASENIDQAAASYVMSTAKQKVTLCSNGTDWFIAGA